MCAAALRCVIPPLSPHPVLPVQRRRRLPLFSAPEPRAWLSQDGAEAAPPRPVGMLFVHVVEATNIPHVDWRTYFSKPDTRVTCVRAARRPDNYPSPALPPFTVLILLQRVNRCLGNQLTLGGTRV